MKKERAREAGDKKVANMKKLREEKRERTEQINGDKQLKIIRDEKVEKQEKNTRDACPEGDSKSIKRGGSPH